MGKISLKVRAVDERFVPPKTISPATVHVKGTEKRTAKFDKTVVAAPFADFGQVLTGKYDIAISATGFVTKTTPWDLVQDEFLAIALSPA